MPKVQEEKHERGSLGRPLTWFISLVATSVITLVIKDIWDAPRPRFELLSLELRATASDDLELAIDPQLADRIKYHPYFPDLTVMPKMIDVSKAISEAKFIGEAYKRAMKRCGGIIEFLKTQSPERSREQRRRDFLERLTESDEEWKVVQDRMKLMTDSYSFPPKYSVHPKGENSLRIDLRRSIMDLSERNPEEQASRAAAQSQDVNTYSRVLMEANRTNLVVRLLAYFEPDVLIPFISATRESIKDALESATQLGGELAGIVAAARAESIAVQVLVSNLGNKPLALRTEGVLKLRVPVNEEKREMIVPVDMVNQDLKSRVPIVEPGKAVILEYLSTRPVRNIINDKSDILGGKDWKVDGDLEDSRLLLLWRAQTPTLNASVVLGRAGADPRDASAGESPTTVVGPSTSASLYEALRRQ